MKLSKMLSSILLIASMIIIVSCDNSSNNDSISFKSEIAEYKNEITMDEFYKEIEEKRDLYDKYKGSYTIIRYSDYKIQNGEVTHSTAKYECDPVKKLGKEYYRTGEGTLYQKINDKCYIISKIDENDRNRAPFSDYPNREYKAICVEDKGFFKYFSLRDSFEINYSPSSHLKYYKDNDVYTLVASIDSAYTDEVNKYPVSYPGQYGVDYNGIYIFQFSLTDISGYHKSYYEMSYNNQKKESYFGGSFTLGDVNLERIPLENCVIY